jgi:hypothetical protein
MESLMRSALVSVCLFFAMSSSPVLAEEGIADQAEHAYATYAGGLSQQAFLSAQYGEALLDHVAGNWVRLNGPDPKSGAETYGADTARFCQGQAALTLSSSGPLALTLTTNLKGTNFTQQYSLIAGSTFGEHTDPTTYLGALGLGPDKTGDAADQQRALLLSLANGLVQIYRPSADILVMTRDRGYPIGLARCPAR